MQALTPYLATFLIPRTLDDCPIPLSDDQWAALLGRPLDDVHQILIAERLMIRASLGEHLQQESLATLKRMLIQRRQPIRGRKAALIMRLLTVDYDGMQEFADARPLYVCSDAGAQQVIAMQRGEKITVQETLRVKSHLAQAKGQRLLRDLGALTLAGIVGNRADAAFVAALDALKEMLPEDTQPNFYGGNPTPSEKDPGSSDDIDF